MSAVERLVIWAKHKPLVASLTLTLILVVLGTSIGSAVAAFKFRELAVAQVELSAIAKQEAANAKRLTQKADSEARRAEQLAIESEQNLYFAEMKEATRSSMTSSGFRQVLSAVQRWDGDANHSVTRGWEWYWLDSQGNQPVFTIDQRTPQPTEEVRNVVWSPDGKYLAWSILREIHIMDYQTREEITLDHPGCRRVMDFCFSPCGNYLASGTYGDGLIVWDWQERARIQHNRRFATISAVDWHPNGDWLAVHSHTASDQGNALLLILEWRKDQVLQEFSEGLRHESERVQFSPDGDYLASLAAHCSARVWNVKTGEVVAETKIAGIHPVGLDWHPHQPLLALCGLGNQVVLGEFVRGETSHILASDEMYFAVHWDQSGRYLLAGGRRNTARVWDLQTGREVLVLKGHTSWVTGVSWNGPSQLIATCSRDQTIKVWNPFKPPAMSRFAGEPGVVHLPVRCCWNPVYPVFVAGAPQHIQIWKADEASLGGTVLALSCLRPVAGAMGLSLAWMESGWPSSMNRAL